MTIIPSMQNKYLIEEIFMKKLLITLLPLILLTACEGDGNTNQNQTNTAPTSVTQQNAQTDLDPTTLGFAAKFTAQKANLEIAFSPYFESNSQHSATECANAQDIYATTIAPIMKVSESSTLDSLWNSDEYSNCNAGITKLVVASIASAKQSIRAAVYDFNNPDIAYALIKAKRNNPQLDIQVIADKANLTDTNSMIAVLQNNNIPVYIASAYAIMHNKFIVIDNQSVEYGSFNYSTTAATRQANNAIWINNSNIAASYSERWNEIRANQATTIYQTTQSQYSEQPYSSGVNVVASPKTEITGKQIYSLTLDNTDIDSVHNLVNTTNSIICPTSISALGATCLSNYAYYAQGANHQDSPFYQAINNAQTSIQIAIFTFTDKALVDDLIAAKNRGVLVQIVADYSQGTQPYSTAGFEKLIKNGIEVKINQSYELLHNKYMIVDGNTVETGSYNYTSSAQTKNAENYQIYHNNTELAKLYQQDWQAIFDQGYPYQTPAQ